MDDTKKIKSRLFVILGLVLFLTVFVLFETLLYPSLARYIKQERDRLVARYTALYVDSDGEGKTASLEKNSSGVYEGYISFNLMNYIDEDVTRRDIIYTVEALSDTSFVDKNGNKISSFTGNQDLYVLDLWGEPIKVGNDSHKYKAIVESVSEEGVNLPINPDKPTESQFTFKYKKNGDQDIGTIHSLNIKLERDKDATDLNTVEKISIIIDIIKPYKQVYVINISVSDYLITFSETDYNKFEQDFKRVYIQSANVYRYIKGTNNLKKYPQNGESKYNISSKALKVTITWDENYRININELRHIQLGVSETVSGNNIDITKPYMYKNDIGRTQLIVYVPECSDFYLEFFKINPNQDAKIYAYVEVLAGPIESAEKNYTYMAYDSSNFDAYVYTDDKHVIVEK